MHAVSMLLRTSVDELRPRLALPTALAVAVRVVFGTSAMASQTVLSCGLALTHMWLLCGLLGRCSGLQLTAVPSIHFDNELTIPISDRAVRMPEIAREITRRWISEVPSKVVRSAPCSQAFGWIGRRRAPEHVRLARRRADLPLRRPPRRRGNPSRGF